MAQLFDADTPSVAGYVTVALEQGIDAAGEGLTYALGPDHADLSVGARVIVPLGARNKLTAGYITSRAASSAVKRIKFVRGPDSSGVSLTADLVELARWLSAYYCCPLGMVFATMLPASVKHGTGKVRRPQVRLVAQSGDAKKLTKLQKTVLDAARAITEEGDTWIDLRRLADRAGARTTTPIKLLIEKGWLERSEQTIVRADPFQLIEPDETLATVQINKDQKQAVQHIVRSLHKGFSVHLLHGVTCSGKTEVYLRALEHLEKGKGSAKENDPAAATGVRRAEQLPGAGAIVLVPEIALTPQTVERFCCRYDGVAVLHSGLSASQRHDQWRRIRQGQAHIVVGARSAVFAPLTNIGLIIVDEEHESSYKQDQLPRYHARDVAIKRAQILGIPVVLGSATPSLESYYNATTLVTGSQNESSAPLRSMPIERHESQTDSQERRGEMRTRYKLLRLPNRVADMALPDVQIVDMITERRRRRGIHLLSQRLEDLLRYTLRQKKQAMLLLNRRGFANYIACPDHSCGWQMGCEYCDVSMVYHKHHRLTTGGFVSCHHCAAEQLLPQFCPVCHKKVRVFGLGTQRIEEEVERKFKDARHRRMDSDSMRTGRDYHSSLESFRRGEVDILMGTQMISKGLDFPNVQLVGVISADTALHLPDIRASERTFQLIAQVAGRAGRSDQKGIVIVQTFSPHDEVIQLAAKHDYEGFVQREIRLRRQVKLPPVARMARIVVRHQDPNKCAKMASSLAQHLHTFNRQLDALVHLDGPAPAPIARIAGFHRQQIELRAPQASDLQKLMTALRNAGHLRSDARTAVDVDPVDMS